MAFINLLLSMELENNCKNKNNYAEIFNIKDPIFLHNEYAEDIVAEETTEIQSPTKTNSIISKLEIDNDEKEYTELTKNNLINKTFFIKNPIFFHNEYNEKNDKTEIYSDEEQYSSTNNKSRKKTRFCINILNNKQCRYYERCQYAHNLKEYRGNHDNIDEVLTYKTKKCYLEDHYDSNSRIKSPYIFEYCLFAHSQKEMDEAIRISNIRKKFLEEGKYIFSKIK
jgi:hypothetical protein